MNYRLLVLALGTFAIGTDSYVVAGILPAVAQSFDTSISAAAQMVSVYAASYALLTPVMATLTAGWSRRRVLIFGLAAFIASNVLTACAPSLLIALASRAIAGLGGATFSPTASAVAAALVAPQHRGRALGIVLAGLSAATALGAPLGTMIGSLGNWRATLWMVAALATLAGAGLLALVPETAKPPHTTLAQRLAPLAMPRVIVMLATTFIVMLGVFLVYTYISVVFKHATHGSGAALAVLISVWGIGATIGSLSAGRLADRFGNRTVLNSAVALLTTDFLLLPWTGTTFASAAIALAVWGVCGWGFVVCQQHRFVSMNSAWGPILLALNACAIYLGIAASAALGAVALDGLGARYLPVLGALLIAVGGVLAEAFQQLNRPATGGVSIRS
ncbi:MAG TPA: MFS transporter [Burkholderiales bacterium]|nr:MFS transporter [Burkholderiales bacterium]